MRIENPIEARGKRNLGALAHAVVSVLDGSLDSRRGQGTIGRSLVLVPACAGEMTPPRLARGFNKACIRRTTVRQLIARSAN